MPVAAPKAEKKHRKQVEESVQKRICRYIRGTYPHIIFFADASGVKMSETKRMSMGVMRSRNGIKADRIPDLAIDHASRGFNGMRLEVKPEGTVIYNRDGSLRKQKYKYWTKKGQLMQGDHLQEQADTLTKYNKAGYFARFAIGFEDAKRKIDWYMENENASLF